MIRSLLYRSGRALGLAALAVLFSAGLVLAQTGRIEGTVRNAQSGDPIAGARVTVVGTDLAGTTNVNGYYAIENVPVGTHNLRVSVIGFQPVTITNQRVASGLPTTVNFSLEPSVLRIEGVVVTGVAERTEVVKLPFTVEQVSDAELPVPAQSAEESLRGKVAGVRILRGEGTPGEGAVSVLLRGATSINTSGRSNEPLYVVDGVILGASMVDIDALEIESIEVVKGAAAAALYGSRAANGVVSITTRRGRNIPEGETRITFRSEFGKNDLEKPIPQAQAHWYVINSNNEWVGTIRRGGALRDTTVSANDRAMATRALGDHNGRGFRPRADAVASACDSSTLDAVYTFCRSATRTYAISDNPYPGRTFDNLDRFYNPGSFYTNTMSVAHRTGSTNFLAQFHETKESGIVRFVDGYLRRGARLNIDHQLGTQFDLSASAFYSQSTRDDPEGGTSTFYGLNFFPIDVDLEEREPDAEARIAAGVGTARDSVDFLIRPDGQVLEENPLYGAANADNVFDRSRFLGNVRLRWRPVQQFSVESDFSFDRSDRHQTLYNFKGYKPAGDDLFLGRLYKENETDQAINMSATASFQDRFGALNTTIKARALLERARGESFFSEANNLAVNDVRDLDVGDESLNNIGSASDEIRSIGYFLSGQFDLADRYIVDALIRRDGSSLFGTEQRWHWYYRLSGAWRMAQEPWWPLGFLDEFKPRYSRGTAGGRPSFSAQYETFSVGAGIVTKGTLGNKKLEPELATEQEFGLDLLAFGRVSASVNYAKSRVENQILNVPLAGFYGYSSQWRNAGTLESNTWEGTLQASLIQRRNVGWNVNFVIDRTRQMIVDFDRPAYRVQGAWYIRNNEILGRMYGDRWATRCNELYNATTKTFLYNDATSCLVSNGGYFDINDDGYLVPVGPGNRYTDGITKNYYGSQITLHGRTFDWGFPIKAWDTVTNPAVCQTPVADIDDCTAFKIDTTQFVPIGNSMPNFNWGLGNTFRVGGLNLYVLFDAQVGGDIYNNTRQWAARELNAWEVDQSGKPLEQRKPILYYQVLYNVNGINSHYVEDGSYVKLREVSLSYTIGRAALEPVFGNFIKRVNLSLIGRNLKTWTDYLGYDPEVATDNSEGTIYRYDGFEYPNYRSFTGAIEIEF